MLTTEWPSRVIEQARDTLGEVRMLARLARDLRGFLKRPVPPRACVDVVSARLATRERSFLGAVERAIYRHATSPYLAMLRHVGCEWGDFAALVTREGVEGALTDLAERGVYVTFDELKARRPIVRGSLTLHPSDRDFDSPLVESHYLAFTGGSGGRPGRVLRPLSIVEEIGTSVGVSLATHGVEDPRMICWLNNPVTTILWSMKIGQPASLWLHPIPYTAARAKFGAAYFRALGRAIGHPFPRPRLLLAHDADRLARWLDRRPRDGRPMLVHTVPSSAVRVAAAANAAGSDLTGVTFYLQSEPLTEARRRHVESTGAQVIATYTSIELSVVGTSCATPTTADDYHLMSDRFALVTQDREVGDGGPAVPAMLVTALTAASPKVCLNTELGDYAQVERRSCGCGTGALGLTTHLSDVRSFEKLSGEGVTFVRHNLLPILEHHLPAVFGGSAVDYQLVEEEAADSSTQLVLRVSPSIGPLDADAVRATFLEALGRGGIVDENHADLLRRAGTVVIRREPPLATMAGKVLPFHLQRRVGGAIRR